MRTSRGNRTKHWRGVFRRVIAHFDEIRETHYSSSVQAFYEAIGREGGGGGGVTLIKPSTSDFICDVELAARAALTEPEFQIFEKLYIDGIQVPESVNEDQHFNKIKNRIMAKVGKMFVYRRIHPVSQYFKPA